MLQTRVSIAFLSVFILLASMFFAFSNNVHPNSEAGQGRKIIVNGIEFTDSNIREFIRIYKQAPKPGNYWYDEVSGLYGVVGYPAYGFLYAGYHFGVLDPRCSNGTTGVFVNGREIPAAELQVWSGIAGYKIFPGRYWFDAKGNAGYEGNPYPVINLYAAARQSAYRNSTGGDNFWSSRFSAGNYNEDNTQGYVSVPGYGPRGYGFD